VIGLGLKRFLKRMRSRETWDEAKIAGRDERIFVENKKSCPACHKGLDESELERTLYVCPFCNHHFRITPWERIRFTVDGGVFQEIAPKVASTNPLGFPDYEKTLAAAREETGMNEAVVAGRCKIENRDVIMAVMAFSFIGGSMGSVVGEKLTRAILEGARQDLPVIIFAASGGARMQEGIFSLMQMAKTANAIALLEERKVPFFVVLTDPTYGGVLASFAMLGDVTLAEPDARIGFSGPRVIEGTIRQKLPEGFQRSEFLLDKGFVDIVVERKDIRKTLAFLIDTHRPGVRGAR
jgi:acetyl-CoA carboxylase carboxyl transferase subunit beta